MIIVYDESITLKGTERVALTEKTIEALDGMLTAYAIPHAFSLPRAADHAIDPDLDICLQIRGADHFLAATTVALFLQVTCLATPAEMKPLFENLAKNC